MQLMEDYFERKPEEELLRAFYAMKSASALREALWGMTLRTSPQCAGRRLCCLCTGISRPLRPRPWRLSGTVRQMMERKHFEALDRADPLASYRALFEIEDGLIYLDGNSLGMLPRNVPARVADAVERQWGRSLIKSWNEHGWFHLPPRRSATASGGSSVRPRAA